MTETRLGRALTLLIPTVLALIVIFKVGDIVIPFILGLAIAYLVYPIVDWFVAQGLRQDRIVIILYLLLLTAFILTGMFLVPYLIRETNAVIEDIPTYAVTLNQAVDHVNVEIQQGLAQWFGTKSQAFKIPFDAEKFIDGAFIALPQNLASVAHWGMWLFIIPFVSFFALTQGKSWINMIFQWTPSQYVESLLGLLAEINAALGGYVRGTLLDALCVGFMTTGGLLALGVEGAVFLGFVTGLLNLVPFLAPIVGGSLALMAAIFQEQSASVLVGILVLYLVVRLFDDFVFIPFVIGHSVRLHPMLMLFAVLAGWELGGLLGLVFAIPLAAVVKVIISVIWRSRQTTVLTKLPPIYS